MSYSLICEILFAALGLVVVLCGSVLPLATAVSTCQDGLTLSWLQTFGSALPLATAVTTCQDGLTLSWLQIFGSALPLATAVTTCQMD